MDDANESDVVQAANTEGNVVLIFIMWISSIVITTNCFVVEFTVKLGNTVLIILHEASFSWEILFCLNVRTHMILFKIFL